MSSKSSSNTSSSSETLNVNEDNRNIAEAGAIALGKDASLNFTNQFGAEVQSAFKDLIDLARDAGTGSFDVVKEALQTSSDSIAKSVEKVTGNSQEAISSINQAFARSQDAVERAQKGDATIFTDLFPFVALGVIGLTVLVIVFKKER